MCDKEDEMRPIDGANPSQRVRDLVYEGKKMAAINRYGKEARVKQREATRVINALIAGELGPLIDRSQPVIVHRKRATRAIMPRVVATDIEKMATQGYVPISQQEEGIARGCAALFAPKMAETVITYRRID